MMTLPRGLLRGWVLLSLLWVCGAIAVYYSPVMQEFEKASIARDDAGEILLPARCSDARGEAGRDFSRAPGERDRVAKEGFADTCWYDIDSYRRAFPEFQDMSADELTGRTYKQALETNNVDPWGMTGVAAAVAGIPPAALLLIGVAGYWLAAGFSPRTRG